MLLINGCVFDGERFQEKLRIRIGSNQVEEKGEELRALRGEPVINLEGDYLLPGFVDVHIHAYQGHDTMSGEDAVRRMARGLYQLGVAGFCPTTMSADTADTRHAVRGIRAAMERQETGSARVLGAHLEAPFLQQDKAGAQRSEFFQDPDWDWLTQVTEQDPGTVKLITLAPERTGSETFVRKAAGCGIHVSVGHTDADAETVHAAADWGADHITHTFNAQTPLHHRKPGVPGAALTDDRYFCEMICDGIHLHRDIVRLIARCKGAERAVAITDAMEAAGLPDGEYSLGGQRVTVKGKEARLDDGTLAGSVLTMPEALENLISCFGIAPADACAMCTSTPARSIGESVIGTISPGSPLPLTRWSRKWKMKGIIS